MMTSCDICVTKVLVLSFSSPSYPSPAILSNSHCYFAGLFGSNTSSTSSGFNAVKTAGGGFGGARGGGAFSGGGSVQSAGFGGFGSGQSPSKPGE